MTVLTAYISGIGLLGPGLSSWAASSAILKGTQPYEANKTIIPAPELLPAAERRRASNIVKLSLATSLEALATADMLTTDLPSVFSFSNGDGLNCHSICECLASEDREISPTRFHNSVHNAVAGYWSIATKNMATSSVLCAYDGSFGAGLLDAMTQVVVDDTACILMTSDTPYPEPMHSKRPIPDNFGMALVITPQITAQSIAKISVDVTQEAADIFSDPLLESLRSHYPSGRSLPLLQAIAFAQSQAQSKRVIIDYLEDLRLLVEVTPC
ncbi:MAG: 3-oxoacyl-ACP synthase [Methylotenera sp.]|nr:MAG: 3-oxoacyl-ACP synthase [Methylotenera sp.]